MTSAAADITYFVGHTKKSRAAIITAALIYAKDGKRRRRHSRQTGRLVLDFERASAQLAAIKSLLPFQETVWRVKDPHASRLPLSGTASSVQRVGAFRCLMCSATSRQDVAQLLGPAHLPS